MKARAAFASKHARDAAARGRWGRAPSGRAFRLQSPNLRLTDGALHTPAQGVTACAESGACLPLRSLSLSHREAALTTDRLRRSRTRPA